MGKGSLGLSLRRVLTCAVLLCVVRFYFAMISGLHDAVMFNVCGLTLKDSKSVLDSITSISFADPNMPLGRTIIFKC